MKSTNRAGWAPLFAVFLSALLMGAAPEEGQQTALPETVAPEPGTVLTKTETSDVEEEVEFTYGIDGIVTKQVRRVKKKSPEEAKAAQEAEPAEEKPAEPSESVQVALPASPGGETAEETAEFKVEA